MCNLVPRKERHLLESGTGDDATVVATEPVSPHWDQATTVDSRSAYPVDYRPKSTAVVDVVIRGSLDR